MKNIWLQHIMHTGIFFNKREFQVIKLGVRLLFFVVVVAAGTASLSSCASCDVEDDLYVTLTNLQVNEITVKFRRDLTGGENGDNGFRYFEKSIPAGEKIEVFLETIKYKTNTKVGKFPGTCNEEKRENKFSGIEFSNDTLSSYTVCFRNDNSNGFEIEEIDANCDFPKGTEVALGY